MIAGSSPISSVVAAPANGSRWRAVLADVTRSRSALAGSFILVVLLLTTLLGPLVWTVDPVAVDLTQRFSVPVWAEGGAWLHPLGTDNLGRDVLARLLNGARISLLVAFSTVIVSMLVGVTLGVVSGYFGGHVDSVIMRIGDIFLAYPFMLLTISIIAILGPSLVNLILVLALSDWVTYARTIRGSVLSVKTREFVTAAHAIGSSHTYIIGRHILPNVMAPVLVLGTVRAANYIIWESGLSFLGMGVPPPTATWGMMLAEGRNYILNAGWLITLPGIAIMLTILSINLLGDGLRDVFDPRLKRTLK